MSEEKTRFSEKWPKMLGYAILIITIILVIILPRVFPEFIAEHLNIKGMFGRFESESQFIFGLVLGLATFFAVPFLFGFALVKYIRSISKKWYDLAAFASFSLFMIFYVLVILYIFHCGDYAKKRYHNDFINKYFFFIIFGYPTLLQIFASFYEDIRNFFLKLIGKKPTGK
jgi:hypothetical protein